MTVRLFLLSLTTLASCSSAMRSGREALEEPRLQGLHWEAPSLDEALLRARESQQPVLSVWGARWCLDCYRVKRDILATPSFAKLGQRYICVYMDMDDPAVQAWAERLGVASFPLFLVLSPAGEPALRLEGGELVLTEVLNKL